MSARILLVVVAAVSVASVGATRAQSAAAGATPEPPATSAAAGPDPASSASAIPVPPESQVAPASNTMASSQLAEVVVTANKRKESTRTIAGGVTAITRDQLDQAGASNLGEYLSLSPGVNFDNGVPGYSVVTIRGVSSDTVPGETQTAVGMYYDDIPLTDPGIPIAIPDIDAFDASRIEVLRGPQGALYGSASLGGAVNYIPASPDPTKVQFEALGSGDLMKNSTWGWSGKAMLNVPLFGTGTALRFVGYNIDQPGYVDNLGTHTRRVNDTATRGGRAMFGWTITPDSTLKLSALYQRTTLADQGYVDPTLPSYEKSTLIPEPSNNDLWLADAHYELKTELGSVQLIGGYQEKGSFLGYDGAAGLGLDGLGLQIPVRQFGRTRGYSGELRLISSPSPTFNWLAGLSYVYHHEAYNVDLDVQDLADLDAFLGSLGLTLPPQIASATTLFNEGATIKAPEEAVYIDASYRFFGDFKLSAGGRGYRNIVNSSTDAEGLLLAPTLSTQAMGHNLQKAEGFNPKVSLSYDLTRGIMFYGLYSKGYRLGGPNLVPVTPLTTAKSFYSPDQVRNVEFGVKSRWWHGRLTADIAAYDIDWTNIPLVIQDQLGLFKYIENAGNARLKGVEGAFAVHPISSITFRSAVSYGDARLKNEFNPNNGRPPAEPGTQLPGAPEWTITNSLIGQWDWWDLDPTVTLIHRFVGSSPSNISFTNVTVGNYNLLDLRAGITFRGLGVTAFGKNITNTYARTAINNQPELNKNVYQLTFLSPPRTLGIELSYRFSQ